MADAYYATKLTDRTSRTPEGFLICRDAVLCRTGEQLYQGCEVGIATDDIVIVRRPKAEVFDPKFLASLEGKPIVDSHGSGFVTADTASWSVRGHVQNVRPGGKLPESGEDCVIGDLIIMDSTLIEKILSGHKRELSVGYDVRYVRNPDGSLTQTELRANHVAVVPNARGGSEVRIYDSLEDGEMASKAKLRELIDALRTALNDDDEAEREEETEYETAEDESTERVLDNLRAMRSFVQASGDRKQIANYNNVMHALKGRRRRTSTTHVVDTEFERRLRAEINPDRSFEEMARRKGALMRGEKVPDDAKYVTAIDWENSPSMTDKGWGEAHRELGRKMREKKY